MPVDRVRAQPFDTAVAFPVLLRLLSRLLGVVSAALVVLTPCAAAAEPIRIGSISSEAAAEVKKFLPLAGYLARQLQSEGIDDGRIVVAESIPQMASFLRDGKVDLYVDSPFPSVAVSRLAGSKFLVRRWKKGVAEYHTVIFAREDSGIGRLKDLRGKIVVFEEPFSTSGYFLPKLALVQAGLRLMPKSKPSDPVDPHEVGYVFSYDDENTMVWVLRSERLAGAMDNQNYPKEAKDSLDRLRVVHTTPPVPRHLVSHRADLAARLVARIKDVLLRMEQSEEGRRVLREFERTTRFDEIPPDALGPLWRAQKFIDAEFGVR